LGKKALPLLPIAPRLAQRGLVEGGRYGGAKTVKTVDIRSLGA